MRRESMHLQTYVFEEAEQLCYSFPFVIGEFRSVETFLLPS